MAIEKKKTINIICENCDSEYMVKYSKQIVSGLPEHCAFCGEAIEDQSEIDYDEDEEKTDDDEY